MASYEYTSKQELTDTIHARYLQFDAEFQGLDDSLKDRRIPEVDKTPAEMIAYQLGWLTLVMGWDREEREGRIPAMPAPRFKWNALGALYQSFYAQYADCSLLELRSLLRTKEQQWLDWIGTLTEEELFTQGIRKWTGSKDQWPMARWIHINSAAPFQSFRAKIRKWKKYAI